MRLIVLFILIGLLISCNSSKSLKEKLQDPYIQSDGSAWHISLGNLDEDSSNELIYATYEGKLIGYDLETSKELFSFDLKAFPYALESGDLNDDGYIETMVTTAQGDLFVLSHEGALLWTFKSSQSLFDVVLLRQKGMHYIATGGLDRTLYLFDVNGDIIWKKEDIKGHVHRLAAGNFDNDEDDEIVLIENRTIATIFDFNGESITPIISKNLELPQEYSNWENPRSNFFVFDIHTSDLNEDGVDEILVGDTFFNRQIVGVYNDQLSPKWIGEKLPFFQIEKEVDRFSEFYSFSQVTASDIFDEYPGKEVISVAGGSLRIYTAQGEKIGDANAKIGFTDLISSGRDVYLGSSPNGDDQIYHISINEDWEDQILYLERKGQVKTIENDLMKLRDQVMNYPNKTQSETPYYISINDRDGSFFKNLERYQSQYPYKNFKYFTQTKVMESSPPLDENGEPWSQHRWNTDAINGTMSIDEIVAKARQIEANKIPTIFKIGHSCMPFITLETAEKILQAAPTYCLGFETAEDEDLDRIPRYFKHYYQPLSDLCVRYGAKFNITKNKGLWWASTVSIPEVYRGMFGDLKRQRLTVGSTEDSNSRTPELNLLGRSGLWLAGDMDYIYINTNSDLFSFNRFFQWEYPKHGHPYFRRLVAHTLLGGSMFHFRHLGGHDTEDGYEFTQMWRESTDLFLHMVGKGIIGKPDRTQVRGFNKIGFVVHTPSEKWLRDAHNGHSPQSWKDDDELNNAIIPHNGVNWGMTNTPDHALQKVLLHKERQFGNNIPATPYGLIAFVPEQTDLSNVSGITDWWHTDGIYAWKNGGPKLTGMEAAKAIKADFTESAKELDFSYTGDDVFMQVIEVEPGRFWVYLIDPGWLDPSDRSISLHAKDPKITSSRDILSGSDLPFENGKSSLSVPAGSMRVIEVKYN